MNAPIKFFDSVICVYQSLTSQAVFTGTATPLVDFDKKVIDTTSSFNPVTGIFTAPVDGNYHIDAIICFDPHVTGTREINVLVGATTIAAQDITANNTGGNQPAVSIIWPLVQGDQVSVVAYQNSGVSLNVGSNPSAQYISIFRVT